jgi:hypothetical protein
MQNRIDHTKLTKLRKASIPSPIHAINYVQLRNSRYYHLYGLLLLPYAILRGVRPVWVGSHNENMLGVENDDEIVILEYPNHNTLLDIFTSYYYESINGLREKGVKKLGFAICEQHSGVKKIGKGTHFVVRFNHGSVDKREILQLFDHIATKHCQIEYLANETGTLDIFKDVQATDPLAVNFKNIGILSNRMEDSGMISEFDTMMRKNGFAMTMQRFRTLGIGESLPWSKQHTVI